MKRTTRRVFVAAVFAIGGVLGCSEKLETGYDPRRLGASNEMRRGFYAQPFSVEAQKAKQYEQDFGTPGISGRPKPGY
jgi:hypothetical protein